MICEKCRAEGMGSEVDIVRETSTLVQGRYFYDEQGLLHCHDPNIHTATLRCSQGHEWQIEKRHHCMICTWPEGD